MQNNKISFTTNNERTLSFIQAGKDQPVIVETKESKIAINAGDFIMLYDLYRYIKDNDIQNDFINYYGKN